MAATSHKKPEGFVAGHPALIATLFAIAVTATFLFLLIQSAGEHHAPAAGHGAASGAPAAHH